MSFDSSGCEFPANKTNGTLPPRKSMTNQDFQNYFLLINLLSPPIIFFIKYEDLSRLLQIAVSKDTINQDRQLWLPLSSIKGNYFLLRAMQYGIENYLIQYYCAISVAIAQSP